jgi:hypothetical protein
MIETMEIATTWPDPNPANTGVAVPAIKPAGTLESC